MHVVTVSSRVLKEKQVVLCLNLDFYHPVCSRLSFFVDILFPLVVTDVIIEFFNIDDQTEIL